MVSIVRFMEEIQLEHKLALIGKPGIGKTEIIVDKAKEEAEKLGKIFVDLREADDETLDDIINNPQKYYIFIRIPVSHLVPEAFSVPERNQAKKFVEFLTPKEIKILSLSYKIDGRKEGIYGVLFIDELTNYYDVNQINALLSIFQEMEIGYTIKLSKNIKVISALNPPRYSISAKELPEPLKAGRLRLVEVDPPTIIEWGEYMNRKYGDEWEKLTLAYLKVYPQDFSPEVKDDDPVSPVTSPRSWTELALILHKYRRASAEVKEAWIRGHLSKDVADKFIALFKTNIDINRALENIARSPDIFNEFEPTPKILVSYAVAQRPLEELNNKFANFIRWLVVNEREFLITILLMMEKKKRAVMMENPVIKRAIEEVSVYR